PGTAAVGGLDYHGCGAVATHDRVAHGECGLGGRGVRQELGDDQADLADPLLQVGVLLRVAVMQAGADDRYCPAVDRQGSAERGSIYPGGEAAYDGNSSGGQVAG